MRLRIVALLIALLSLCSGARSTGWTAVNHNAATSSVGVLTMSTPPLVVVAGTLVIVPVVLNTTATCTDTAGDVLVANPLSTISFIGGVTQIFSAVSKGSAANVVTCNFTNSGGSVGQYLYSGNAGTPANTGASGSCTTCGSGNSINVVSSPFNPRAGDLIFVVYFVTAGSIVNDAGAGYTNIANDLGHEVEVNTGMSAAAGSQTATATFHGGSGISNMSISVATFSLPACSQVGAILSGR